MADKLEPQDDYDDESDPEDDEGGLDDCGMTADGTCMLAGTEWCDWCCPLGAAARFSGRKSAIISNRLTPPEKE